MRRVDRLLDLKYCIDAFGWDVRTALDFEDEGRILSIKY
jgi:hypothetical protein